MEEVISGEQPAVPETDSGSPFGKFQDTEALRQAYQNLEREFTRKSQLLSNFQKQAGEEKKESVESEKPCLVQGEVSSSTPAEVSQDAPFWERADWNEEVQEFLHSNPAAREHAREISKIVLEDKSVSSSKRPLYSAWAKFLQESFKTPEQLLGDEKFLQNVTQNEKVRRAIIKDYLSGLNERDTSLKMMSSRDGGGTASGKNQSPKNLREASEMVKKILNK